MEANLGFLNQNTDLVLMIIIHMQIDRSINIVCIDLWGKELHKQVYVDIVVIPGSLCGVMVAHLPGIPEMWVPVLL